MSNPGVLQVAPVCINAPVVSGTGETEVLERISLSVGTLLTTVAGLLPAGLLTPTLSEVVPLVLRVTVTDTEVYNGRVLVSGVVHKDLLLKILPATTVGTLIGAVVGATDCTVRAGVPLDLAIDCPYTACISVPGACPGDQVQVDLACVDADSNLLIDTNGDGLPELYEERYCVRVRVRVIRNTPITITPDEINLCPTFPPVSVCPSGACTPTSLTSSQIVQRLGSTIG